MLDWLIVGGGIHGTHLSHVLVHDRGVPRDAIRVLDPWPEPLARWNECTENTGMRVLRSPFVHQIDTGPFSLRQFTRTREGREAGRMVGAHRRPALSLFRAHSERVVRENGLAELRIAGRAAGLREVAGGIAVESDAGELRARRVVLAMGAGEQPAWPAWAWALREEGAPVNHLFELGFRRAELPAWERAAVVGLGISGAQCALAMAAEAPGSVTLLGRHPWRVRAFDADPGWMGPRYLGVFARERCMGRRREMITAARHRGSMTREVAAELRAALFHRRLALATADVVSAAWNGGEIRLELSTGGTLRIDRLVLATGFAGRRPGGEWVDRAVDELGLPCAPCGYPVVDAALRWHPRIHVSGPLAELEVGPPSRNIVGARLAAQRLAAA